MIGRWKGERQTGKRDRKMRQGEEKAALDLVQLGF